MSRFFSILALFFIPLFAFTESESPKTKRVLHLTFNKAYATEFTKIAKEFGCSVTNWLIPALPPCFLDGVSSGNVLYNITHERAQRIWDRHRATFESFDLICVTDSTALSRIFLQNGYTKPLLVWICRPFDYADTSTLDGPFPDVEYYDLLLAARNLPNVTFVASSPYMLHYAGLRGMDFGDLIIPPCALNTSLRSTKKNGKFYVPPYHNETTFMNLTTHLQKLGLDIYNGDLPRLFDLSGYKGVVHLPCDYSAASLFEHLSAGIIYFLPSPTLFEDLLTSKNYFHEQLNELLDHQFSELSEWYDPARSEIFVYFDSWEDLIDKIHSLDYEAQKEKILAYMSEYQKEIKNRWQKLFQTLLP
ncbi:MAG: hypothetical protein KGI80_04945 [Verrucomicrobiota bacterium]|nr:hypothetical protein [Verrucomicrobiota bacterium]